MLFRVKKTRQNKNLPVLLLVFLVGGAARTCHIAANSDDRRALSCA
jgi:hypothetical protein